MQENNPDLKSSIPQKYLKIKLWILDKFQPNELAVTLAWAGLVGILGGLCSVFFRKTLSFVQSIIMGSGDSILQTSLNLPVYHRVWMPVSGAIIAGLILYFGFQIWKKIPVTTDILEAIVIREGILRFRPSFLKALSSLFSLATGASLGREGPISQLSTMAASKLGQIFNIPKQKRSLITACGAASGIAAAYNAPIAGALFVMEIILGNFAIEIFGPLIFASVVATVVSHAFFGSAPIYQVPGFTLVSHWEIIPYLFLGILGGIIAPCFQYLLNGSRRIFEKLKVHTILKFAIGGFIMGLLAIQYPYVWGNGFETVSLILNEKIIWYFILLLLVLKAFSTSVCLGSGMVGGLFTPTLFLGASLGAVFGHWIHFLFPNITGTPGGYALVGMGCLVAGTTHAPLTAILILFELTLNYSIILPLLLACTVSTFVASQLKKQSIYTEELERKGQYVSTNPEALIMTSMTVDDIYLPSTDTIYPDTDFGEIVDKFFHIRRNNLYVTDQSGKFLGAVSLNDLREIIQQEQDIKFVLAFDIMNPNFLFTSPGERLSHVMEKFWVQDCERLPVVDNPKDRIFVGTISKRDILGLYSQEVLGKHHLLTKFTHGPEEELETTYIELGRNIVIKTLAVPEIFDGFTLANLNIGSRYDIQVISIRRKDLTGREQILHPSPEMHLRKNDLWVVMGEKKDLDVFERKMDNPLLTGVLLQDGEGI